MSKHAFAVWTLAVACFGLASLPARAAGGGVLASLVETAAQQREDGDAIGSLTTLAEAVAAGSEQAPAWRELQFELVRTLVELGLYQTAFTWLDRIVEMGDSHPHYIDAIDWLLRIHEAVPGETAAVERLADYDPLLFPPAQANRARYYVGRYLYSVDELDRAVELLGEVEKSEEEPYLKAQFLLGVTYVRLDKPKPALEAFKNILRYQRDVNDDDFVERMARKTLLNMARLFYSVGQFDKALKYYDQIEQDDPEWLDALFESAWTWFRLGRYDRSLGNLFSLNSPYFADRYYPEARVLQAVILFTNCHYAEARKAVDTFVATYRPLKEKLELRLKQIADPLAFYGFLAQLAADAEHHKLSAQMRRVLNAALADRRLRTKLRYVVRLDEERKRIERLRDRADSAALKKFLDGALGELATWRGLVAGDAGQAARDRFERIHKELTGLLSQALRIKVEVLRAQHELIQALQELGPEAVRAQFEAPPAPVADDEHVVWPFDGEYWRDELGSYTVALSRRCLDALRHGGKATGTSPGEAPPSPGGSAAPGASSAPAGEAPHPPATGSPGEGASPNQPATEPEP